jgi:hypothetical protein
MVLSSELMPRVPPFCVHRVVIIAAPLTMRCRLLMSTVSLLDVKSVKLKDLAAVLSLAEMQALIRQQMKDIHQQVSKHIRHRMTLSGTNLHIARVNSINNS